MNTHQLNVKNNNDEELPETGESESKPD